MRPADEGLLGVELAGGHRHRGLPVLDEADVLGLGRSGAERRRAVGHLEVVGHVALRPVGDHLGDAELAGRRRPPASAALAATSLVSASIQSRLR